MTSSALRTRKRTASLGAFGSVAVVAATLGAGYSRAQGAVAAAPPAVSAGDSAVTQTPNPFADRFPNVVLKSHEGKAVRFYDDLLKGKIVVINFMYASCKGR